ncbi:MAG: nitric oxide reductase activation protein NorD [Myxococcota bacterium]
MGAPELSLDWEEGVFRGLWNLWRRLRPTPGDGPDDARAARLDPLLPRLTALAQILCGRPVRVRVSEGNGGVRGSAILLPAWIDQAETPEANESLYVARTAVAARLARDGAVDDLPSDPLAARVDFLLAAADATRELRQEMPGLAERLDEAPEVVAAASPSAPDGLSRREHAILDLQRSLLRGESPEARDVILARLASLKGGGPRAPEPVLWGGPLSGADRAAADDVAAEMEEAAEEPDGTEIEAPPRDDVKRVLLDKTEEADPLPVHTFEKVETLEEFSGGKQKVDGADDLEDHAEALDEVDLREVFRGGKDTHSIFRADLDIPGEVPDVHGVEAGERGVPYDEWDTRAGRYRKGWVKVYPAVARSMEPEWGASVAAERAPLVRVLQRRLEAHRTRLQRLDRQMDGDEIDVDAVVEEHAFRKAGRDAPGRVYKTSVRRLRDTACTVLLDTSLSAGSWVDNRRVLDVTREAVVVLGEVAERLEDQLQVLAFASNTRNLCRVWEVKGWRDSWALGRARLGGLKPQGYTRIGAPLRHAVAGLQGHEARHKLVLLVTDGKPTDYDRYEGAYGIADVRQAVREAAKQGITVHALAYDPAARASLPSMFGPGGFQLIRRVHDLPRAITEAWGRRT